MDLLGQLMQSLQVAGAPRTMQAGRNGKPVPSSQGHLPPAQQKDTWLENDPRAMQAPPQAIRYPRSNPETGFYDAGPMSAPQEAIRYPRSNPDTGYYDAGPAPQEIRYPRSNPQSGYYKAGPNSPVEMRQASDPMAQLRQLLGL